MHFTWEFSLGQVIIGIPVFSLAIFMFKIYNMLLMFRIEHELLMKDWADTQNPPRKLHELPWRQKKWW